jgi:undecaprenyl-diphosphatase
MDARPLLAHRRIVGCVVAAAVAVTVGLGVRYSGTHKPGRVDVAIDARLSHHLAARRGTLDQVIGLIDPISVAAICALMCALFLVLGRRRLAILAILGPITTAGLVELVLKPIFNRRFDGALSFPSGHTATAVAIALVIIVALLGPSRPPWPAIVRAGAAIAAAAGAATIATALVGAGYHYATDTLGGLCLATACVLSLAWVIDAVAGALPTVKV